MASYVGNKEIKKIYVGSQEVADVFVGANKVYSNGPTVDPVLNNNDWATIRAVCEAGEAANYWALGDTKADTGTDSTTRHFQIVDMQGLYNKHVVFLQVELESTSYQWNNNLYYNEYNLATIRTTTLPEVLLKYSSDLQGQVTDTTYKVSAGQYSTTLLDLTDKLFLPAVKELFGVQIDDHQEESDALTQFQYFATNSAASYKIKYQGEVATAWWTRSPRVYANDTAMRVPDSGTYVGGMLINNYFGVAPCFSF